MSVRFEGKTVVVTGAGGFIGSTLVEHLVAEGADVRALVRYTSRSERGCLDDLPESVLGDVTVTFGDVRDIQAISELTTGAHFIFHLAALIGIPYSYEHPQEVIDTNVMGTANVLLAAKEGTNLERLVLTSTSEVYGSALRVPIDEDHPLQAQSPYSATKIAADALGVSFSRAFELPITIVRPFNTYGPRQSARAVIPTIITQALTGGVCRLGTLDTFRDFTFVDDTAEGFVALAASAGTIGEVVNLGSGKSVSVRDVVAKVEHIVGHPIEIVVEDKRIRPEKSEVSRLLSDPSKALKLADWQARVSLEEGLQRTATWIQAHLDEYRPSEYGI
ncbi:MAG TPA: SDR family NAD(P)-dependent oxidoreductase [Acidimicrobiales bacterium]|nr:SDR family NAD(P)-dependent oxidoreductase [Acidimicrobiales bacterium]